jgi:hypothetical protein
MENNIKIEFLKSSIADSQGTIRAIDTKLQVMFGFLLLPIPLLGTILTYINELIAIPSKHIVTFLNYPFAISLIISFIVTWTGSLLIVFAGLNSIGNPFNHVENDTKANGSFYLGNLFKIKFYHALFRFNLKSLKKSSEVIAVLPATETQIINELIFEQMKVAFIRDLKMFRQKAALFFLLATSFLGILIVILVHCSE